MRFPSFEKSGIVSPVCFPSLARDFGRVRGFHGGVGEDLDGLRRSSQSLLFARRSGLLKNS